MTVLLNALVPASIYNSLPHIHEVSKVPDDHDRDLEHLRGLLAKHKTPKEVAIRLIHKHFDTRENEVMVFDKMPVPGHGMVQTMRPMQTGNSTRLRGIHYFVDQAGNLQPFEYSNGEAPDMASIQPFLDDFARSVAERGLQHKFGLKLNFDEDLENTSWNEFEFPQQRSTIMLQDGMPMPAGGFDCEVNTEWKVVFNEYPRTCKHSTTCKHGNTQCKHCKHCMRHDEAGSQSQGGLGGDLLLAGQKVLPGTPIHDIVQAVFLKAH
ncbi:hypothetical protein MAPG_11135 [Magnaporthiopsis poae ATCC 64411]|uniref:Uncharacterized protein n=1 Tax=Magnaporthiopsis poae (strain ATCC 64411 / 73-15) TaxID=644358 RepID=A0A0C4EEG2_MAGP6|nr:hypothetical protein MAPG_11135 [Magnaporthiopsis poae ATCC 64411]